MEIISAKKENFSVILKALKDGKVLVCPTDTVYGLVCDAANKKAVERIFKIKKRDRKKPLPVFIKDINMAKKFTYINKKQDKFLKENWPGKITVVLKGKKGLTGAVYKKGTIGMRMPDYKLLNLILEKFQKPIAQTSANISGKPAATKIKEVLSQFESIDVQPDLIINAGNLPKNKPSKIIDLINNKILRR